MRHAISGLLPVFSTLRSKSTKKRQKKLEKIKPTKKDYENKKERKKFKVDNAKRKEG
jgi:hypothetical protein